MVSGMKLKLEIWPDMASSGGVLRMHLRAENLHNDGSFAELVHPR